MKEKMRTGRRGHDAVVIGTGIGGSACGALLARQGFKTLILEKNDRTGGICSHYQKRGFQIDYGTHLFSRGSKGPLGEVERRLGIPGRIRFIPTTVRWKGIGYDFTIPRSPSQIPGFVFRVYRQMGVAPGDIPNLVRLARLLLFLPDHRVSDWDHRSMEELLFRYSRNPRVLSFFSLSIGLFFVLPLWESSAGEGIHCARHTIRDNALSYPLGGTAAVPRAYLEAAVAHGARVLTEARVKRIRVRGGVVAAVELADGRAFETRAVVSSTSLKDTVFTLAGRRHFPADYADRVGRIQASSIAIQAKVALDRPVFREGCLVGFGLRDPGFDYRLLTLEDLHGMFADVSAGRIPKLIPFYCPIPSNHDPGLAPPGKQLLTICTGAPTLEVPLQDPCSAWHAGMMRALETNFPEVRGHTEWVDALDVRFVARWTGKRNGPAISTGQTPGQVTGLRPSVRSPLRGLYFAGDNAGGRGIGTELAAQSALECSEAVAADFHRKLL